MPSRRWTNAENAILTRLMAEGKHPSEMTAQLPGRTAMAIAARWDRMEHARFLQLRGTGYFGSKTFAQGADAQAAFKKSKQVTVSPASEGNTSQAAADKDTQAEAVNVEPQQEQTESSDAMQTEDKEMAADQEPTETMDCDVFSDRATVGSSSSKAVDDETVNVEPELHESTGASPTEDKTADDQMDYEPSVFSDQPPEEEHSQPPVTNVAQPGAISATAPTEQDLDTEMQLDPALQSTDAENRRLMTELYNAAYAKSTGSTADEASPPADSLPYVHAPTDEPLVDPSSVGDAGSLNQTPQDTVDQGYKPRTFPSLNTIASRPLHPDAVLDKSTPDSSPEEVRRPLQAAAVPDIVIAPANDDNVNPITQLPPQGSTFPAYTDGEAERELFATLSDDPFDSASLFDPVTLFDPDWVPDPSKISQPTAAVAADVTNESRSPLHEPDFPNLRNIADLRATSTTPIDQKITPEEYEHLSEHYKARRTEALEAWDHDNINLLEQTVLLNSTEYENPKLWEMMARNTFQGRYTAEQLKAAHGDLHRYKAGVKWHTREWSAMDDIMLLHSSDHESPEEIANKLDRGPAAVLARWLQLKKGREMQNEEEARKEYNLRFAKPSS